MIFFIPVLSCWWIFYIQSQGKVMNLTDAKPSSVTNQALDNPTATLDDGVNAAKVAAMKAAELGNHDHNVSTICAFLLTSKTSILLS